MEAFDAFTYDGHTRLPRANDRTLCWQCEALLVFDDTTFGLRLRRATQAEKDEFEARHGDFYELIRTVKQNGGPPESIQGQWRRLHPPAKDV